jgi:DNA-binding NarL/FixJ family response regulator/signal transduction histidine kinase
MKREVRKSQEAVALSTPGEPASQAQGALEAELKRRTWELTERIKELRCLYGISRLRERPGGLNEFLRQIVELVPPAWQFPEVACARICIGDLEHRSANFGDAAACQSCEVVVHGHVVGLVEVRYREILPQMGEQPFLAEEQSLVTSIAERVGSAVAHYEATERVREYQERLRSLASELALTSERERRRIAQELHNQIGHTLASIKFRLSAFKETVPPNSLDEVLGLVERAIQVSRDLTFELSPPVLHELGLGAALEWLVHQLRANYGIAGEYQDDHQPKPLREDLRVELFQAMRELLTNVGKHSHASMAQVRATVADHQLRLEVRDDGIGYDPALRRAPRTSADGWGLFGIRERLAHLGARMKIESTPGHGTHVVLTAPLIRAEQVAAPLATALPKAQAAGSPPISILLVEDQTLTRTGLRSLLERQADFKIVAEAADGEAAVELNREHKPDVVVMDIAMPKLNGIEATRRILQESPTTRVIALSMHADSQYVLEMLRVGASGYLLKDCAQEDLAQAIRIVHANLSFLSPGLAGHVAADIVKGRLPADEGGGSLTPRELEILKLLARGRASKEIAADLKLSPKTVESHRQHVMKKLRIDNLAELTRYAIQRHLVEAGD